MRRFWGIIVAISWACGAWAQLTPAREESLRAMARGETVEWSAPATAEARALRQKAEAHLANLRQHHLPNGLAVGIEWQDEARTAVLAYDGVDEGAGRQGRYLAALALKYAVQPDEETVAELLKVLGTFDLLTTVSGREGYLVRYAAPASDEFYRAIYRTYPRGEDPRAKDLGKEAHKGAGLREHFVWLGDSSPAVYDGAALGLAAALKYVGHPEVQVRTRRVLRRIGKCLIEDEWNLRDARGRRTLTAISWRLTWMRLLMSADPAAYEHLSRDYGALHAKLLERRDSLLPSDKYSEDYASNVHDFDRYFVLCTLESDPERRGAYRELVRQNYRRAADHLNAYLAAVYLLTTGDVERWAARATLEGMLLDFPKPPYLLHTVDNRENDDVEMLTAGTSKHALLTHERIPAESLWGHPPCQAVGGEDKNLEFTGLDFILPYWMGRRAGIMNEER